MTDLDTPLYEVDLLLEPRLQSPGAAPRISGRVTLGTPVVRPLEAGTVSADPGWREFLEAQAADNDYLLLSVFCSFRAAPSSDPIVDAAVGVNLQTPGEPADRQPIAWSINPKHRVRTVPHTGKIALTANLTVVEAAIEYAPQGNREELFLVGMGERDSDPEWRFRAIKGQPLIGDEELTIVVKKPAGVPARADISLAATIRHRRLGLIPYRADLPAVLRSVELSVGKTGQ